MYRQAAESKNDICAAWAAESIPTVHGIVSGLDWVEAEFRRFTALKQPVEIVECMAVRTYSRRETLTERRVILRRVAAEPGGAEVPRPKSKVPAVPCPTSQESHVAGGVVS